MNDQAASIQACALRVTALDANGKPLFGAGNQYVLQSMIELTATPVYEAGEEYVFKSAVGGLARVDRSIPKLKWLDLALAITNPDVELTQLLTGGTLVTKLGKGSGWMFPAVGATGSNGVILEVWSKAILVDSEVIGGQGGFFRWVFPKAQFIVDPRTLNNDAMAVTFAGFGASNPAGATKLIGDWPIEFATGQPGYFRDTSFPTSITVFPPQHGYATSPYGGVRYANAQ